jgi:hypothetical protein
LELVEVLPERRIMSGKTTHTRRGGINPTLDLDQTNVRRQAAIIRLQPLAGERRPKKFHDVYKPVYGFVVYYTGFLLHAALPEMTKVPWTTQVLEVMGRRNGWRRGRRNERIYCTIGMGRAGGGLYADSQRLLFGLMKTHTTLL